MFWIIQENLFNENGRDVLLNTLARFDIPHQVVKVVPFEHRLDPEPIVNISTPIIVNGSILLSKIATSRNWFPGGFLNNNFDYEVYHPILKNHLLNHDAVISNILDSKLPSNLEYVFVRPTLDSKSFNGQVMATSEFISWKESVLNGTDNYVKPDTMIVVASPKTIGQEIRHFVVDGKVITSSRYKLGGRVNYAEIIDRSIIDYAQSIVDIWQPARAFVLDTYVNDDIMGVVEIGGICMAGFYAIDVQKLVMALEDMKF